MKKLRTRLDQLKRNLMCTLEGCYAVNRRGQFSSMYWQEGGYVVGRSYACHRHQTLRRKRWDKPMLRSILP